MRRLQAALDLLIRLNDKYALDGGAPPSYGGLLWCLGWRDRPQSDGCPSARPTSVIGRRIRAGDLEKRAMWRCGGVGRLLHQGAHPSPSHQELSRGQVTDREDSNGEEQTPQIRVGGGKRQLEVPTHVSSTDIPSVADDAARSIGATKSARQTGDGFHHQDHRRSGCEHFSWKEKEALPSRHQRYGSLGQDTTSLASVKQSASGTL